MPGTKNKDKNRNRNNSISPLVLKDDNDVKDENETPKTVSSTGNSLKSIPIDCGVEYNSLESPKDGKNFNLDLNNINGINSNSNVDINKLVNNAMENAMLQFPTKPISTEFKTNSSIFGATMPRLPMM